MNIRTISFGFYSSSDFIELGQAFGVAEDEVREHIAMFAKRRDAVEKMLAKSALSAAAKSRYLVRFRDRLRAMAQEHGAFPTVRRYDRT